MSEEDIIKMWKDESYRASHGDEQAPENPAGEVELTDEALEAASGGAEAAVTTWICLSVATSGTISCIPSCDRTVWDGTCNVASIGCCEAVA
jgi:mersacidin/lichenicidin family type 2 lantibiotic